MSSIGQKFPALFLTTKCALLGGLIMFLCMAAGELFVNPNMYGGLLKRPHIWPLIFVESAAWLIPCMLIVLPMHRRLITLPLHQAIIWIAGTWIMVGTFIVVVYKQIYYPQDWSLNQLSRPDITFGWTLPCILIFTLFIGISVQYLKALRAESSLRQ